MDNSKFIILVELIKNEIFMSRVVLIVFMSLFSYSTVQAQKKIDSSQIGKEYPYVLPILGKQAYAKGYQLQRPFGIIWL